MVGLAVSAHQTGAIHTQHNVKLLQSRIMNQHIIASLQKSGINGENRDYSLLCHAGCHGDAVPFRNTDVKEAARIRFGKRRQASAILHGGSNGTDPRIFRGAVRQRLAESGGERLPSPFQKQAGLRVKRGDPMEFSRIPLRKGVSLAFPGMYMNQYRAIQLLRPGQHIAQAGKIMAVDGAEIGKAHIFKERTAGPN